MMKSPKEKEKIMAFSWANAKKRSIRRLKAKARCRKLKGQNAEAKKLEDRVARLEKDDA